MIIEIQNKTGVIIHSENVDLTIEKSVEALMFEEARVRDVLDTYVDNIVLSNQLFYSEKITFGELADEMTNARKIEKNIIILDI